MTQENYNYRTSQTMLRNKFPGKDRWQIPIIPRFEAKPDDFSNLLLIGFDKTNLINLCEGAALPVAPKFFFYNVNSCSNVLL